MRKIRTFIRRVLNRVFHIKYETFYLLERNIDEPLSELTIDKKYRVVELTESNFEEWDFSLFDKGERWHLQPRIGY